MGLHTFIGQYPQPSDKSSWNKASDDEYDNWSNTQNAAQ